MHQIAYLIENTASGLYLLGGLVVLLNLRRLLIARNELFNAEFELEREFARRKQAGAITWALAAVEAILAVYAIAHVVAPTLRADVVPASGPSASGPSAFSTLSSSNATLVNAQGTPIDAGSFDASFATLTAQPPDGAVVGVIASPTTAPTPPGTIVPGAPPPIGCERPRDGPPEAVLEIPANGQVLYESLTVRGIANTAGFARYKFEISGPSTGNAFAPFGGDKNVPVKDMGFLGQVSLLPFNPGTYQFRLAVFDSKDQLKASCTVTVFLRLHPPTPTPITPTAKAP